MSRNLPAHSAPVTPYRDALIAGGPARVRFMPDLAVSITDFNGNVAAFSPDEARAVAAAILDELTTWRLTLTHPIDEEQNA